MRYAHTMLPLPTSRRIVVTGCAGFIGSRAAELFLEAGHRVVGIDALVEDLYPNSYKHQRLARFEAHPNFSFEQADLATDSVEPLLEGVQVVVHFAAMAGLAKSWTHPEFYVKNNVVATKKLVDATISCSVDFFVHASTSSVYGDLAVGDETLPFDPISPYGETKIEAERTVAEGLAPQGIGYSILRYFSVYGPRQRPDMAYSKFCNALLSGETLRVTGDGSQRRSNTFIDDAARAALIAAEVQLDGEIFNIAGSESIALIDGIDILAGEMGVSPLIEFVPDARGDQKETAGDSSKAQRLLGWTPEVSIEEGLRLQARAARESFRGVVR